MCLNNGRNVIPGDIPGWPHTSETRRARAAVAFLSIVSATSSGAWAARIPDVRAQVGISDAAWGLANTLGAVVNLAALAIVAGVIIGRVSMRRLATIGTTGNLLAMPIVAHVSGFRTLTIGLSVWFTASCLMSIPTGALQIEVQRRYGRPLQGSFIACFGVGTFIGAGYGTACASLGISVTHQFLGSSALLLIVSALTARWLPQERAQRRETQRLPLRHRFTPQMRTLGAVAGSSQFIATTLGLWAAYYIASYLGAGGTTGAAAYTVMSVAGIVAALGADRVVARFGDLTAFCAGTTLAAVAMAAALAIDRVLIVAAGFVLLGIGMACVGPAMYSFISRQNTVPAADAVSVIEMGDSVGALVAPSAIGGLASLIGLRSSLTTIILAAGIMILFARRAASPG